MVEAHGQMVVLVDVPVYAGQVLVVGDTAGIDAGRASVIAVLVLDELRDGLHVAEQRARRIGLCICCIGFRECRMPVSRNVLRLSALVVDEEEELVLEDGTTESETVCLLLVGVRLSVLHAVHAVAVHVLAGIVGISRTLESVGTRLGNSVDTAANEVALAHIEGSYHHLHLVDGIH